MMPKPFIIIKQQDELNGCIPACAVSVLNYFGELPDGWDEQVLLALMNQHGYPQSGFHTLQAVLTEFLNDRFDFAIGNFELSHEFLSKHNGEGLPVLHAHQAGARAHCVVLTSALLEGVTVHDPAPTSPAARFLSFDAILSLGGGHELVMIPKSK